MSADREKLPIAYAHSSEKRCVACEVVPELLEAQRAVNVVVLPQQIDQLAVGAHGHHWGASERLLEGGPDGGAKPVIVRRAIHHERRECVAGIEHPQLTVSVTDSRSTPRATNRVATAARCGPVAMSKTAWPLASPAAA